MKIINTYIQERISANIPGKINAPTFAYMCLHGKGPNRIMSGRGESHPSKIWNGIAVDKDIPTKSLQSLDKIKKIELRSSCQGSDMNHPTFVIFRLVSHNEQATEKFVKKINKDKDIKCCWGIGNEGKPRIIITAPLWSGQNGFEKWWLDLSKKILKYV